MEQQDQTFAAILDAEAARFDEAASDRRMNSTNFAALNGRLK
jgi:hypothetical protein